MIFLTRCLQTPLQTMYSTFVSYEGCSKNKKQAATVTLHVGKQISLTHRLTYIRMHIVAHSIMMYTQHSKHLIQKLTTAE